MIPVKICGITRPEDARLAVELGAAALGFIFYKPSPRYVDPERAAAIVRTLPPFVTAVGVFVQATAAEMNAIAERSRLDRIQLHGDEPYELLQRLSRPAYRAFRLKEPGDVRAVEAAPDADVLLDTFMPDRFGGTGRAFDWTWARGLVERLALQGRRVILAGGLTPETVGQALREVRPHALDISSGVEAEPGIKDESKLRALFRALETTDAGDPLRSSRYAFAT
jgi:phosphoribosylanthranilate isomerase